MRGAGRSTGPKGAVLAGLGAGPGKRGGVGWVRPGTPAALKTTPVYLGAGQETYWLPLPPSQTVGRGREWAWGKDPPLQNFLQMGQCPRRGYLSSLPWRGIPSPGPKPLGREGILGEEGPGNRPCPQLPQTHPNLKAMRVRVYRNYVQSPEKPPYIPWGKKKKKTRQKLIYIFCIWSSVLNINCVIFIHFLSLNSPLIYQFNVSWGFFSHGVLCPAPTPLFDWRRLILSIVAFCPHVTTL